MLLMEFLYLLILKVSDVLQNAIKFLILKIKKKTLNTV